MPPIQKLVAPACSQALSFLIIGNQFVGNDIGNVSNNLMAIRYHNAQKNAIDLAKLSLFVNTLHFYLFFYALCTSYVSLSAFSHHFLIFMPIFSIVIFS
ncbi:MAG TPA: hypothetical protein DEQ64_23990 [Lachnoclostridium sp.]|nr:hypothetical protein [Lachnoclostridium sp.]